jgi:hypothetical protein
VVIVRQSQEEPRPFLQLTSHGQDNLAAYQLNAVAHRPRPLLVNVKLVEDDPSGHPQRSLFHRRILVVGNGSGQPLPFTGVAA